MRKLLLFLFSWGFILNSFSQKDSMTFASLYERTTIREANEFVYNGKEHISYHPSIIGIPFYASPEWQQGMLVYEGISYKDVFLKYDLVTDEVMIRYPNGFTGVILFTPRIQSFTLNNKKFVNLTATVSSSFKTGIYEEVVRGKVSLFIKRSKFINESISINNLERSFLEKDTYYLVIGGTFHPVRKQSTAMDLLKEKKTELNAYLKKSGIKYKANPEAALTTIVTYYNQLSF